MLSALQKAKKNGAKIMTINPLPETGLIKFKNPQNVGGWIGSGTQLTDLFLQVKINGDVALLKAMIKLLADEEATVKRVTPDFFKKYSVEELSQWSDFKLGKSGRLTHPMILREGNSHYEEVSWEDAFSFIGKELNSLASPNEAIFYTSGRTSNEAAFLYQLFVRQFGTNNLPDCSNMCHESSGVALSETVGIGKGSVRLEDFYVTDLIIVMGQNPGTNHPRMLSALQKAKKNGAKIMTINPLPETGLIKFKNPQNVGGWIGSGTQLTDLFLQVKINGDVALLKAMIKLLADEEAKSPGTCLLYTSPSPRDATLSRMPSSA